MIIAKSEIIPHKADFLLDLAYPEAFKIGLRAQLSFVLTLLGF